MSVDLRESERVVGCGERKEERRRGGGGDGETILLKKVKNFLYSYNKTYFVVVVILQYTTKSLCSVHKFSPILYFSIVLLMFQNNLLRTKADQKKSHLKKIMVMIYFSKLGALVRIFEKLKLQVTISYICIFMEIIPIEIAVAMSVEIPSEWIFQYTKVTLNNFVLAFFYYM